MSPVHDRHSRESGNPELYRWLDSRFRGDDDRALNGYPYRNKLGTAPSAQQIGRCP